jgi:hypothetical protein
LVRVHDIEIAGTADTTPPKKTTMKRGLMITTMIVCMAWLPYWSGSSGREGNIVFEKMKIKPADMVELRMMEINMVTSSQEGRSQLLQSPEDIAGGLSDNGRLVLVLAGMWVVRNSWYRLCC